MTERLEKEAVHYRPASDPLRRCGTCVMFRPPSSCTLVAGQIGRNDVCDRWAPVKSTTRRRAGRVSAR